MRPKLYYEYSTDGIAHWEGVCPYCGKAVVAHTMIDGELATTTRCLICTHCGGYDQFDLVLVPKYYGYEPKQERET